LEKLKLCNKKQNDNQSNKRTTMGWRSLYLSNLNQLKLSLINNQLLVTKNDSKLTVKISDIDVIVADTYNFTISGSVIAKLSENHIALIVTSPKTHLPTSLMINPYTENRLRGKVALAQIKADEKFLFQCWKRFLIAKIEGQKSIVNQDYNYKQIDKTDDLATILGVEGSWGKIYWRRMLGEDFNRSGKYDIEDGDTINAFLNYSYAVIRARVASAICEYGMIPSLGLFHSGLQNPFALADDLIEPYRWVVEKRLVENLEEIVSQNELTPNLKKIAILTLREKVKIENRGVFELSDAIAVGAQSLQRAFLEKNIDGLGNLICRQN